MEHLEDIFPFLIGFGLLVVLPIVSMLLKHQARIAEMIHQRQTSNAASEVKLAQMQAQIDELKAVLYDHAIRVDDQRARLNQPAPPPTVPEQERQRLGY